MGWFDQRTPYPNAVQRSLITLKALMHRSTGGLVAAPTMLLPEKPGSELNLLPAVAAHVRKVWTLPDQGLWESRGEPRQ